MTATKSTGTVIQLGDDYYITDKNGCVYRQEIEISQFEADLLTAAIEAEIAQDYPREKKYVTTMKTYLQPFTFEGVDDRVVFLNHTTTRFINLFLKLELEDENTYIYIAD